jgi:hypothetical protein
VGCLRAGLALRLAAAALEPFLAENVAKEVRKDALVIRAAAEGLAAGAPPGAAKARELLAAARAIDREFLERVSAFPVRIAIAYERVEPLRMRRIELGLALAWRILAAWQGRRRMREAFAPGELERSLREMLELYARETRALSHSVRMPALLALGRERLADSLHRAMCEAAAELAREAAHRIGEQGSRCSAQNGASN